MRGRWQRRTPIERLRERRWQRPPALRTGGELTSKANLDQSEVWVVPATVRAKDTLIAFGDDCESTILVRGNRPLELLRAPSIADEPARGHHATVDADVGDAPQWAEVAKAEGVDLSGAGEHVARSDLANTDTLPPRHDLDSEIPVTHEWLPVKAGDGL